MEDLDKIDLLDDVFLKNVPDKYLVTPIANLISQKFKDPELQFFTWVECSDHNGNDSSFWFFPVVSFSNNTTEELIENTRFIIDFGRELRKGFREKKEVNSIKKDRNCIIKENKICNECPNEESVRVTLVNYPKPLADEDSSEYLEYLVRKHEIIKDNLEEYSFDGNDKIICLTDCDNRFEQKLGETDILVLQNGEIGNALYRAWISTGYVKQSYTFVVHKKTMLPVWVGKSTFDPAKDEEGFARACKGVKEMIKKSDFYKAHIAENLI